MPRYQQMIGHSRLAVPHCLHLANARPLQTKLLGNKNLNFLVAGVTRVLGICLYSSTLNHRKMTGLACSLGSIAGSAAQTREGRADLRERRQHSRLEHDGVRE